MKKIKVTVGTVGFYNNGAHATKTTSDEPFMCDDEQAAHFVKCGVAEYVEVAQEEEKSDESHLRAEQLETMTNEQLKNLAGDLGIDVAGCKKKADFVAAIVATEIDDEENEDELPDLSAADPE